MPIGAKKILPKVPNIQKRPKTTWLLQMQLPREGPAMWRNKCDRNKDMKV